MLLLSLLEGGVVMKWGCQPQTANKQALWLNPYVPCSVNQISVQVSARRYNVEACNREVQCARLQPTCYVMSQAVIGCGYGV